MLSPNIPPRALPFRAIFNNIARARDLIALVVMTFVINLLVGRRESRGSGAAIELTVPRHLNLHHFTSMLIVHVPITFGPGVDPK